MTIVFLKKVHVKLLMIQLFFCIKLLFLLMFISREIIEKWHYIFAIFDTLKKNQNLEQRKISI